MSWYRVQHSQGSTLATSTLNEWRGSHLYSHWTGRSNWNRFSKAASANLHELTHELAHISCIARLSISRYLDRGWREGWAVYWVSFWVLPHVYDHLGEASWPYPHNYLETDGPAWYAERITDLKWISANPILQVVRDLALWQQRTGSEAFVDFFKTILKRPITTERINKLTMKELKKFRQKQSA